MLWFRQKIRVVAVLAGEHDRELLSQIATQANWSLQMPRTFRGAIQIVSQNPAAVIIGDQPDWRAALETLRINSPNSRIILTASETDDKLWLEVLDRGGFDVVTRPFHPRRLLETIGRAWNEIRK